MEVVGFENPLEGKIIHPSVSLTPPRVVAQSGSGLGIFGRTFSDARRMILITLLGRGIDFIIVKLSAQLNGLWIMKTIQDICVKNKIFYPDSNCFECFFNPQPPQIASK